ncbi:MAG: hypothetical protein JWR33_2468 [Naasia sp.]|jgi:heme A synthase|uniref:hypothetical protein n=1 Tax=Naasia sp. TaxID=2546198 RepID=UPI002638B9F9|nr:hypothetical protein [Naasia sp.]MCU1571727.1 hypothetical protein [Naasia sp.]
MSLTAAAVLASGQTQTALPMSPFLFGLITLAVFALLGMVMWSYRDVANRHSQVSGRRGGDGSGSGGPHGA